MKIDLGDTAALLKRATEEIRGQLPSGLLLTESVRLILDFDEDGAVWSTEFGYKHRRRTVEQTFYGPGARTPIDAIDRLLADVLRGLP